ncbi:MAG: type II secretion system minor pseudopilin GspJ [Pseudomonadota bacterium]
MQPNQKMRGFTLLEILVALFIFTIIAIIMTRALHMIFESQTHTEENSARMAALQIATLYLEHDLTQAIDRPIMNGSNEREAAFIGKSDNFHFTHGGQANPQAQLDRSTLQRVNYRMADQHFTRETWQVLDQISTSKSDQRQLLDKVTEVRFEYLDDKGKYSNSWPPQDKTKAPPLPNAVRVHLTLAHWGTITQIYIIPGKAFVTRQ